MEINRELNPAKTKDMYRVWISLFNLVAFFPFYNALWEPDFCISIWRRLKYRVLKNDSLSNYQNLEIFFLFMTVVFYVQDELEYYFLNSFTI